MQHSNPSDTTMDAAIQAYLMNFEQLPCGIAVAKNDPHSTILQANSAFYTIIGHTKAQFHEKYQGRLTDILIDNLYDVVEHQPTNQDYDVAWDLRFRAADGTIRWVHDHAHYDAKANVFYVMLNDITDKMMISNKHLSYNAFQARNEIVDYLSLHSNQHITVTDAVTDQVVYLNQASEQMFGFQQESDWLDKPYWEIGFGHPDKIHPSYLEPVSEDSFTIGEYYNHFHKKYFRRESKLISVPSLQRKLRLNIITDITAHTRLAHQLKLQKTLHQCVDTMFTTGTNSQATDHAYYDILSHLKEYYKADGAFFYKFTEGTYQVEKVYEISQDGQVHTDHVFPASMTAQQIQLMQALSDSMPRRHQAVLDSFQGDCPATLKKLHAQHHIQNFACTAVNNGEGQIMAFMGVTNPHAHKNAKTLLELLSRFVYMFVCHQQDEQMKEDAVKLEAVSKLELVEKCGKSFQDLVHPQEAVNEALTNLCHHYDADFAIIISHTDSTPYSVTHMAGKHLPDLGKMPQSRQAMGNWLEIFEQHDQFATDLDFDDAHAPIIKKMLLDNFGIYNFVASPMRNTEGDLFGLLIVNNLKLTNRSHLMVHVVAKNVADYEEKIQLLYSNQLEPLSKLSNKIATEAQIAKALEDGENGTLFLLDIDNFKELNDVLGHQVGDQAIVDLAEILKKCSRTTDIVGRVGGDEFMIFCHGLVSDNSIQKKAQQIGESCDLSYEKDGITVKISVSIGVCTADDSCRKFQCLYQNADSALYCSKNNGKHQYQIYPGIK